MDSFIFLVLYFIISEFLPRFIIYFKLSRFGYSIFSFFNQRFLIEFFYNKYIVNLVLKLGSQIIKVIDKGSVELLGPFGLEKGLINLSNSITNLSTGNITSYALYILLSFIYKLITVIRNVFYF